MESAEALLSGILSCRRLGKTYEHKEQRLFVPQVLCHRRYEVLSFMVKRFQVDMSNLLPTEKRRTSKENRRPSLLQEEFLATWKNSRSEISMLVNSVIIYCPFLMVQFIIKVLQVTKTTSR